MQYKGMFWYFLKGFYQIEEFKGISRRELSQRCQCWKFLEANPLLVKGWLVSQGWREKRGPDLGSLKEEKIDGITLRQKAEKCKIWLQIAASPKSQILKKKLCQRCHCRNLVMCTISQTTKSILMNLFWRYRLGRTSHRVARVLSSQRRCSLSLWGHHSDEL